MTQTFKAKLAHMLDNGDKLEFESFVEACSHDDALAQASTRMRSVIGELAGAASFDIDKSKIEQGAHRH
ncbi:MAG: hypothetical protein KJ614_12670 [Gammaproteobacteria bacterium]|uniref:hypothetical protein n=1 Tax=Rhodoferax sp. TaxID=50421 RepID=UPI0017A405D6|nr:hypothetical protein [Rhodoferax sp.]MBU3899759.1 hypothetical protein [Gammaproteobacteria bacterium]MBA3057964.1 hypothetical protein [Rhodoferax sp.]MBU3997390.1 hypothetical protein [Gammaproteobacteria bacterium]MBU4018235.1 hypothetical protein [Gammaproteobacteria bacterium]MBU4080074.1 hypothetical protein [Gammaproteobacteria bacterium]